MTGSSSRGGDHSHGCAGKPNHELFIHKEKPGTLLLIKQLKESEGEGQGGEPVRRAPILKKGLMLKNMCTKSQLQQCTLMQGLARKVTLVLVLVNSVN